MGFKIFLTIGGSDPSGGAGIQADIKTAGRIGLYPCSVITSITAQNSCRVDGIWPVTEEQLYAQLKSISDDFLPDVVKIGMLSSAQSIDIVSEWLTSNGIEKVVVDPVLSPTLKISKPDPDFVISMVKKLFPIATLVTPNLIELQQIEDIAHSMFSEFCSAWLVKGGHSSERDCIDTLYRWEASASSDISEVKSYEFCHARLNTANTHGSGCVLSSAIASYLGLGYELIEAVERGIDFLTLNMNLSKDIVFGKGNYGPILL